MTNTKKQFFKSNFYFFTDADIDVSTFDELFKQNYNNLKFKLYINDCKNDDTKLSYSLYLNKKCDKDLFNSIVDFIFNFSNTKFNIFYKHLDNSNTDKKYDYSYIIKVENKQPQRWLFLDEE
jgi:hypothetical protein